MLVFRPSQRLFPPPEDAKPRRQRSLNISYSQFSNGKMVVLVSKKGWVGGWIFGQNTRKNVADQRHLAEWGGFEPPIRFSPYDDLANRCLQPLGHHSSFNFH